MFFVQIAGRLGKDPESRFTANNQKVTTFSVAINQKKGKEDVTTWVRVTIWGDRFDRILPYLKKGSGVIVCGKMSPPSTYVDKEGRTQLTLEITAEAIEFNPFGGKADGDQQNQSSQNYAASASAHSGHSNDASSNYANYQRAFSPQTGSGEDQFSMDDDTLPF